MWNRWWIRIPVALVFGVLSMQIGAWLSVWIMVVLRTGILDFAGGSIVSLNIISALSTVAMTIVIAEIYSSLRKQPIWTVSYLIYFVIFSGLTFTGLWLATELISPMPVYYYPVAIVAFAVWAGVNAARFHAKRRIRRMEIPVGEAF